MLATIVLTVTVVFCVVFFIVSWRVKDSAASSFAMYAIGGGALPLYLILFSDLATIMGAGNFIGHATSGFTKGISHIPFIVGEQGSKIVFALVFAGFAGRFAYITISDLMYDLLHRDKITQAITGLLTGSIMLAWLGGQAMGLGYIFEQFTNIDPVPVIIFFNAVFILYTYLGGVLSVVWTDFIQGIIVVVFGFVFYYFALAPMHWDIGYLGSQLTAVAGPEFWDFSSVPTGTIVVNFVTGCFGVLAAQVYWQRCFAAKDARTARTAMLISGVLVIVLVSLTAFVGMTAKSLNPDLDPSLAMPWLMMNYVPLWVVAVVYALVLAAAMSSADSLLNASAIIVVNDVIRPFKPDTPDQQLVDWTKKATIVIGVVACSLALYAESIIDLFAKAYTMAGGGVVPVLIVGLLWKSSRKPFQTGEKNSRLTPWGVRVAVVSGAGVALTLGILWGILVATLLAVIVSLLTRTAVPDPVNGIES
ncbi:MAG: sodium:solute symporter family protein [Gammaproteobacteria bacterium]|nr:sodium:solute symporter family protein [Gammaproteobacteria bacterium]